MTHAGVHDSTLVLLSVGIAIIASYTALDLAARMRTGNQRARRAWLSGAAIAMGGGIWSMHFVAMLAFSVPGMEVVYDLPLTLASLAIAVLFTAFGFACAYLPRAGVGLVAASGLIMGLGIAGMHFTGMAAMRMPGDLCYDTFWVGLSLLIAIGASTVALWLSFRRASLLERVTAAVAMGLAVSGMHYAAMQGASFAMHAPMTHDALASVGQTNLAMWVATTTLIILLMALGAATLDRSYTQKLEEEADALRESEERFRLLVQSVSDYAIVMLDPDGRVTNWNAGADRIHGYAAEEMLGRSFAVFYSIEDRALGKPQRALDIAKATGKFQEEAWRVRKDGSRFFANVLVNAVYDDAGTLVGFAKVTRDLTEWRHAQKELELAREALFQAQKMEAIGQLTGGVAHDFNNLLAAVLGSLELLRKRLPDDPRLLRLVDNALQGAQRGANLTQRLLSFSRRQHLQPVPVDLRDLVTNMTDLLSRSIGPQHRIETRFPIRMARALVDPHQLELALLNLVVNARDAMPNGGRIVIAATDATTDQIETSAVVVSVSDSGIGMDEETLARAKEPFFTTKGVGKGTGLGLSMVHGLAEQSAGRLVLRSEAGRGTTAEIWLPMAGAGNLPSAEAQPTAAPMSEVRLRVMVVDDDPLVLENAAAMLEDHGHRVIEASSAEEAIAIFGSADPIDVLLTDHIMPGMTGIDLAHHVVRLAPSTAVVVATGYSEAVVPSDFTRLQKPFPQAELLAAIAEAMRVQAARHN